MAEMRCMTTEDYEAVRALWSETEGMGLNDYDDSPAGIARYIARNPGTCFVAVNGAELVGAILAGHDGRRGFIYHAAVRASERGKGLGRALVERALVALEREGIHKVALVVFASNQGGNRFWERIGFAARGDLCYRNRVLRESARIEM